MTTVDWHKFPDEQPPHDGWYMVTFRNPDGRLCTGMVDTKAGELESNIITAWAEMPMPYEEE